MQLTREERILKELRRRGLDEIVERHALTRNVTVMEVVGRRRYKNIAAARHGVWRELRLAKRLSFPEIARLFDVDHTTVMSGVRSAVGKWDKDLPTIPDLEPEKVA